MNAISTTELSERIGYAVPADKLKSLGFIPVIKKNNGIYWDEEIVPMVFISMIKDLSSRNLRIIQEKKYGG